MVALKMALGASLNVSSHHRRAAIHQAPGRFVQIARQGVMGLVCGKSDQKYGLQSGFHLLSLEFMRNLSSLHISYITYFISFLAYFFRIFNFYRNLSLERLKIDGRIDSVSYHRSWCCFPRATGLSNDLHERRVYASVRCACSTRFLIQAHSVKYHLTFNVIRYKYRT